MHRFPGGDAKYAEISFSIKDEATSPCQIYRAHVVSLHVVPSSKDLGHSASIANGDLRRVQHRVPEGMSAAVPLAHHSFQNS